MQSGIGLRIANNAVLIMDIIGLIGLAVITLGTKSKFMHIFANLLETEPLPIVTKCFISVPEAVYLVLFVGMIVALVVKEKYIRYVPLKFSINIFVLVGGCTYLLIYLAAMFLPMSQVIEKLGKGT